MAETAVRDGPATRTDLCSRIIKYQLLFLIYRPTQLIKSLCENSENYPWYKKIVQNHKIDYVIQTMRTSGVRALNEA
jgi:hypothetical protein